MFHPLRVTAVDHLTDDAVAVTFAVPPALRETYAYTPGQHIALRHRDDDGEEIRRTYSLCAPAESAPSALRIGVRRVEGGVFSTYALKELAVGDHVDVLPPTGRFSLVPRAGHFAAIVGGSGITPVLSIAATLLDAAPEARFCLVRSDRSAASTMFLDEVADLKDRYPERLQLVHALSREEQQTGLPSGRLDEERLTKLLPALLAEHGVDGIDGWYLCGPLGLVTGATKALRGLGVPRNRVHQEIFHAEEPEAAPLGAAERGPAGGRPGTPESATVAATLDGRSGSWAGRDGESVLETVLRNRADAPYACKGGVCGTCRVRLLDGEVRMDRNYALEPDELDAGYVLACQSHPVTPAVTVDFDA
ncbi:2Fe-2S iron-sulfur cluster-binding protein [Streptomyces sp. Z26]|uniref:2Fe-2S iron-sulfur cluster-binding protein n=1 Tax=Streptomyces sp. Z26 TaxID=2500177 RepID=UPI000EF133C5|nr:2Fe-2S iron-sulfur cluster-binding protein [Streptomyces sp. Z26]RLL67794.1 phenylacetic acid degradation protein [Streptomyces sp. Z26]